MDDRDMLVSIIIPIYRVESFLPRCVDSVLSQTYTQLEVILVDDGSPDKCPEICDNYSKLDGRVKVIHQVNQGLSAARNHGLDVATGEYIYFLDSDDYISEDCIQILMNLLIDNNAEIAVGKLRKFFDGENPEIKSAYSNDFSLLKSRDILSKILNRTAELDFVIVCNKLVKASVVRKLRFPLGKFHEDEYFNWKLYTYSNSVVYIEVSTYYYYQRKESITGNGFGNHNFDYIGALEERIRYFKDCDSEMYAISVMNYRDSLIYYFYLRMIELDLSADVKYSLEDIHKLFIKSYKEFSKKIDCNLISRKESFKRSLFYIHPKLLLLFINLMKIVRS